MNKNPAALEALVRRNALACEHALKPRCKCQCRRALHRKPHSEAWIKATVAELLGDEPERDEPGDPDGEAFRGGEAAAFAAEESARIQREYK